ncbi:MAG: hypothetical protein ACOCP8_08230 [archaeon]
MCNKKIVCDYCGNDEHFLNISSVKAVSVVNGEGEILEFKKIYLNEPKLSDELICLDCKKLVIKNEGGTNHYS